MNYWCESCARKNLCYVVDNRPKCFVPITNTASGTSESYLAKSLRFSRDGHEIDKTENSSEKPNNSTISKMEQVDEPQSEQWHYDEKDNTWYPYQHKSCATCKHALGNWDGESNNCGRCCGADRRFYEPKDEPKTERNE